MMKLMDLHVHSDCSDGTCSPAELVRLARESGLAAFALTDHDTTAGIDEALQAAEGTGIEVIPGIEFSTSWEGHDIHVLGLGIRHRDASFQERLLQFRESRSGRNRRMIEKMRAFGIDISLEQLRREYPDSGTVLTRAHFARFLLEHGYASSMDDAFRRYIGEQGCCFVPRQKVMPFGAIEAVLAAGGIPVLAHPLLYGLSPGDLDLLTARCKAAGLAAIEAIYSSNKPGEEEQMRRLARKYHLKITGGSDFHGSNKPDIHLGTGRGNLRIPYALWQDLQNG